MVTAEMIFTRESLDYNWTDFKTNTSVELIKNYASYRENKCTYIHLNKPSEYDVI